MSVRRPQASFLGALGRALGRGTGTARGGPGRGGGPGKGGGSGTGRGGSARGGDPPRGRGRSQSGLTSRGVLLLLVLFVLAATAVYPLREHVAQQERIDQLREKQAALQAANQRLERERARLHDPAYVDQLAKQEFNLIQPGEEPWLLTGTPPAGTSTPPAPRPAPKRPWYQRAWHWLTGWVR